MAAAPATRTGFFGRERERGRLAELALTGPLVTLTGPGGVGKTRLAAEIAAETAGPVSWCALTPLRDDAAVAAAVAAELGRDRSGDDAAHAVADALNERGGLLVLDNCEHVIRGVADLAERLLVLCPELRLLCTSREAVGVEGEAVLLLGPLALPDDDGIEAVAASEAVSLFVDRARLVRWDFELTAQNVGDVARICRRLDGLPLALELAAARIRSLTPAEIAAHLDERFTLLARPRSRAGDRHRTLRATLDWSYQLLDEEERLVFERLSVFAGGADLEAAAAVCAGDGVDEAGVLDLLDALVDRSLVQAREEGGRTRYGMLETLRHYAHDRLAERGDADRVHERHADHHAALADRFGSDVERNRSAELLMAALALFEEVRAAALWSMRDGRSRDRAIRLLVPLWALAHSRHAAEISDLCEQALDTWPLEHDELGQALLGTAAVAAFVAGRGELARARAAAAIQAEERGAPPAGMARRAMALLVYGFLGEVEEGVERLEEAIEAAHALDMPATALELVGLRAQALVAAGRREEGVQEAESLRALADALDNPHMQAWAVYMLGTTLMGGDDARAEECFEQSLRLASPSHLVHGSSLRQLGGVLTRARRHARAAELLADAYEHFTRGGDRSQAWDVLRTAAGLFEGVGRGDRAAQILVSADADERARRTAPLEAPAIDELRTRLADHVERASAAPLRLEDLGPVALVELRELAAGRATSQPAVDVADRVFRRQGELWTLSFEGTSVQLPDLKGLHDIARLLAAPGEEVHCLELAGGPPAGAAPAPEDDLAPQGHAGELLDARAKAEYRARMEDLREQAERAEAAGDEAGSERAREELEKLADALSSAFGLGGRPRKAGDPSERARTAVTWRVRSALRKIDAAHPALGIHLRNSLRTGLFCVYRPERPVTWVT